MTWTKQAGMSLLGMVSGSLYAQAKAINDAGQIIGLDQTGTSDLAFYTAPGISLKFSKGWAATHLTPTPSTNRE